MVLPAAKSLSGVDHYGVLVYQTLDEVLADGFVKEQLSAPTLANVGGYLVSAYEIATSGWQEGDIVQIFNYALDIALDIAAEIAVDVLGETMQAIPLARTVFSTVMGITNGVLEAQKMEAAQAAAVFRAKCRAHMQRYQPRDTGTQGEFKPSDYFVLAKREPFEVVAGEVVDAFKVMPERIPYIGRMLQLITETQYSGYFFSKGFTTGKAMSKGQQGFADELGIPLEIYQSMSLPPQYPSGGSMPTWACLRPFFPLIDRYVDKFRMLREAIVGQSIAERQLKGMSAGDGGTSLWPLYQDLLFSAIHIPRWPYLDDMEGYTPVPPLNEPMLRRLYGSNYWSDVATGLPDVLGFIWASIDQEGKGPAQCEKYGAKWPKSYDKAIELMGSVNRDAPGNGKIVSGCMGPPIAAFNSVLKMSRQWGQTVRPIYADDQAKQAKMLEETWSKTSELARVQMDKLGLTQPKPPVVDATALQRRTALQTRAIDAIGRVRAAGLITEEAAQEGAAAVNGGAKPSAFPVVLAGAALGVFFMRAKGK